MRRLLLVVLALLALSPAVRAQEARPTVVNALPPVMRDVDLEERLGQSIDPSLTFTDTTGKATQLGSLFATGKPVLLVLAYYRCPTLCGLVLRGVVDGLKHLDWKVGDRFQVVTVSFDPRDRPEAAKLKRNAALTALGRPGDDAAWPFLVGEERETRALAESVGFRFAYDKVSDQYAHPAAIVALTPDGRVSRYLYGVEFSARDLRLALLDAAQGNIGTIADRVLMTCYRYDPALRRYGPSIFGFLRLGGVAILATVATLLGVLWHRERRGGRRPPS